MKRTATDMVGSADGKVRPPPPAGPAPSGESTFINQKLKPVGAPDGSRCWEDFYEMQAQVGEGMYGQVYKMKEKSSNETVALKKVRMANEKEGFPITAIREIKLLSKFADPSERRHPASGENIVRLKEIVNSKADADNDNKGDIFMVLEYMEHDLSGVRESPNCKLTMSSIKTIMNQILTGIEDCHSNKILHRDLKCSNVLMNRGGDVKLADFGLARSAGDKKRLTPKVITLWYRPPELLMGQQEYDYAVDIWSAGCILAELFLGKPLLPGRDESDQIAKIFDIFGTPREPPPPPSYASPMSPQGDVPPPPPPSGPPGESRVTWKGVSQLPLYERFVSRKTRPKPYRLRQLMQDRTPPHFRHFLTDKFFHLLEGMLAYDPSKRLSASECVYHDFFYHDDPKWDRSHVKQMKHDLAMNMRNLDDSHEYELRVKRKAERERAKRFV